MIQIDSEVGRLRKVLVHEPGLEVDHMVPATMDELLFDDVLFGDRAREEHALFRRALQLLDVEVVEAAELLTETLQNEEARAWLTELLPPEPSESLEARLHDGTLVSIPRDGSLPVLDLRPLFQANQSRILRIFVAVPTLFAG